MALVSWVSLVEHRVSLALRVLLLHLLRRSVAMVAKGKRALRSADFFRRVPRDLTEGSAHGGTISLIATAVMLFLVFGEFVSYNSTKTVTDVYADTTTNSQLRINFDVFFPQVRKERDRKKEIFDEGRE